MKKIILLVILIFCCNVHSTKAQNVNIPDPNFKTCLVGNASINTSGDTEIQVSEAAAYTGAIDCNDWGISDLTGIEAFTALDVLNCGNNQLTSLDLSNNTALTLLNCFNNQLSSLDVSNNTALTNLMCNSNELSTLDVVNNTDLSVLNCSKNQLSSLNVSNNTGLTLLYCQGNALSSLDVINNTALNYLSCYHNQLGSLDLSNNTTLMQLTCSGNQLVALDVSNNTDLTWLQCDYNQLNSLNAANTNNTNFTRFTANNNPSLFCIQVDDSAYSANNWTAPPFYFDTIASFSENCGGNLGITEMNSTSFGVSIYPNPNDGVFTLAIENKKKNVTAVIFSLLGEEVYQKKIDAANIKINLRDHPTGVYLLQLSDSESVITKKIVIE